MAELPASFDNVAAVQFFDLVHDVPLSSDLTCDASAVSKLSTLAIQLLLSIDISLQQQGYRLIIEKASPEMQSVMNEIGLADVMKRWSGA